MKRKELKYDIRNESILISHLFQVKFVIKKSGLGYFQMDRSHSRLLKIKFKRNDQVLKGTI